MTWHRRFFWLLILLLPTQLGIHFWPDWAHVLGRRVDYLSPTLYLTDILIFFTVGTYIIFYRPWPRFAFFLTLILFAVVNIFVATNQMVAFYKWIKFGEFIVLGWYIVRTKPKLSDIVLPLSIGVLYSSVLAIAQFLLQHSVGGPLWWLGERTFDASTPGIARFDSCQLSAVSCQLFLRPYATFPHPNVLGGFLAVVLPLITLRYLGDLGTLGKKTKTFLGITIVSGVIALMLTFSRSAIIVGILVLASVFFRKKQTLFFLAILLFIFSIFHFPLIFSEESFVVRWQLNAAAVNVWQSAPLFGVGLGNFLVRLPEVLPARTIYFLQPVHNIYLLLLSEIGVVGVVVVVWVVWETIRSKTSKTSQKQDKLVLLVPLLTLLLLGVVDHYPLSLQQGQLLLTILIAMRYN